MHREAALACALLCAALLIEMLFLYIERRRVSNKLIQAVLMGSVFWLNKRHVAGRPWGVACLVFMFFPVAFGLCVIFSGPYLLNPAALVDAVMKIRAVFQDHRLCTHWPPPLVIPESLDERIRDTDTPRQFVCPLTFSIMRQPAVTPYGTTYDYEAVASWADAKGRYPAHESDQPLLRSDLAPNRALRGMIEEWVAARSSTVSLQVSCDQPARDAQV